MGSGSQPLKAQSNVTTDEGILFLDPASLGGPDGGERFRAAALADPERPVAMVVRSDREPYMFAAFQLGARGCFLAEWTVEDRLAAEAELVEGGVVLTRHLARLMLLYLTRRVTAGRRQAGLGLTEPEAAVLHALADGLPPQDPAVRLGLTRAGVRACLRSVLEKLQDRSGPDGPGLLGAGVPRRPPPGFFIAAAEAMPEDCT